MVFVYDIGKSRWQADFGREALEWAKMHGARFTFNGFYGTGNNWNEPIYELITPIYDIQYIASLGQFQRV